MVSIYNYNAIKKGFVSRIICLALIILLFAAIFILSIYYPSIKWVSMVIAALGCILSGVFGVLLLAKASAQYRFVNQVKHGITTSATLTVTGFGQTVTTGFWTLNSVIMTDGSQSITLLVEGEPFKEGQSVTVVTHNNRIVQYQING